MQTILGASGDSVSPLHLTADARPENAPIGSWIELSKAQSDYSVVVERKYLRLGVSNFL